MQRHLLATAALLGLTAPGLVQTACAQSAPPQTNVVAAPADPDAPFFMAPAPGGGYSAGNIVVRLAAAGIVPLNSSTRISPIGGHLDVTGGAQPEVDISYFVTKNLSVQLIATATRHEISANNTKLAPVLGNKLDLGSTYVLPPAITAQWHFLPQGRFDPYVGAGIDFLFPFDTQESKATLDGTPIVQKMGISNAVGAVLDVGFDYNVSGPWFLNFDFKQVFNRITARVHTAVGLVKAVDDLNPSVFSAGIAYRF